MPILHPLLYSSPSFWQGGFVFSMAPVDRVNLFYFCCIALHFSPHLSFSLGFGNSAFLLLLGDNSFAVFLIADASLYIIPLILSSSLQVVPLSDIYNENIRV